MSSNKRAARRAHTHTSSSRASRPLVVEIRPGEGGADALAFASELASALGAYVRRSGVNVARSDGRTICLELDGDTRPLSLDRFSGTHRIQRIPRNDRAGRRHTSTASVAVLEGAAPTSVVLRDEDLEIDVYRSSGNGGQHMQKNSTAVRLTHIPSGLVVCAERSRSQYQNLCEAKATLTARLQAQANEALALASNAERQSQIAGAQRPVKQWTWNDQRGEVLDHSSGTTYPMRELLKGRLELVR